MAKRHDDALYAQAGACNFAAVVKTGLLEAAQAVRAEGGRPGKDPAVRMIMHQLCHLAGIEVRDTVREAHHYPEAFDWDRDYQVCIDNASERVLEACNLTGRRTVKLPEAAEIPIA